MRKPSVLIPVTGVCGGLFLLVLGSWYLLSINFRIAENFYLDENLVTGGVMSIIRDEDCISRNNGDLICIERDSGKLICLTKKEITTADVSKDELLELALLMGKPKEGAN